MNEHPDTATASTPPSSPAKKPPLTKEEAEIVALCEKDEGRKLTEQEINVALMQARMIGDL